MGEENKEETLTKKVAAMEIYKVLNSSKNTGYLVIVSAFITALLMKAHDIAGIVGVVIVSILAAFIVVKDTRRMQYLQQTYNLNVPKIFEVKFK